MPSSPAADAPVLLVTGASSGIGAALARAAVAGGMRVALLARRAEELSALAGELGSDHALAVPCDVRRFDQLESAVRAVVEAYGSVDAVFAGAGVGAVRGFGNDDLARWRAVVETNILGTALTIRACADALRAGGGGHLVLMGSVYGRLPAPGSLYSASKRAVAALAESARLELGGEGVRVTLVEAGTVDTPFFDNPQADGLQPTDVTGAVLWAIGQPAHVDVSEIVVRATAQR